MDKFDASTQSAREVRESLLAFGDTLKYEGLEQLHLAASPMFAYSRLPTEKEVKDTASFAEVSARVDRASVANSIFRNYVETHMDALRVIYYARAYLVVSVPSIRSIVLKHKLDSDKKDADKKDADKTEGLALPISQAVVDANLKCDALIKNDAGVKDRDVADWFGGIMRQLGSMCVEPMMVYDDDKRLWHQVVEQETQMTFRSDGKYIEVSRSPEPIWKGMDRHELRKQAQKISGGTTANQGGWRAAFQTVAHALSNRATAMQASEDALGLPSVEWLRSWCPEDADA